MVSDTRCARGGGDTGWFLTRFTGLTGLRGGRRNAEGAEITRRARREKGKLRLVARLRYRSANNPGVSSFEGFPHGRWYQTPSCNYLVIGVRLLGNIGDDWGFRIIFLVRIHNTESRRDVNSLFICYGFAIHVMQRMIPKTRD